MGLAFEMALAALRPTPDYADPVREVIARKIIELAKAGERDPERLYEGALSAASPADPSGWRGPLEGGQPPKPERRRSPIAIMEREKYAKCPQALAGGPSRSYDGAFKRLALTTAHRSPVRIPGRTPTHPAR